MAEQGLVTQLKERAKVLREQVKLKREQILGTLGLEHGLFSDNPGIAKDFVNRVQTRIKGITTRVEEIRPKLLERKFLSTTTSYKETTTAGVQEQNLVPVQTKIAGITSLEEEKIAGI